MKYNRSYGKGKCCIHCHEKNLEERSGLLYKTSVITADDFYPNLPGDKVSIFVRRNPPRRHNPKKGEPFSLKISVWGGDDYYLIKLLYFSGNNNYQDKVFDTIQLVKKIPIPITIICLRLMGFDVE